MVIHEIPLQQKTESSRPCAGGLLRKRDGAPVRTWVDATWAERFDKLTVSPVEVEAPAPRIRTRHCLSGQKAEERLGGQEKERLL